MARQGRRVCSPYVLCLFLPPFAKRKETSSKGATVNKGAICLTQRFLPLCLSASSLPASLALASLSSARKRMTVSIRGNTPYAQLNAQTAKTRSCSSTKTATSAKDRRQWLYLSERNNSRLLAEEKNHRVRGIGLKRSNAMNRIVNAIEGLKTRIANLNDAAAMRRLETAASISFDEYTTFQNVKSEMQAGGVITYDEAVTIYEILGSGPEAFKRHTLAERIIVIKTMQELMAARLAARLGSL